MKMSNISGNINKFFAAGLLLIVMAVIMLYIHNYAFAAWTEDEDGRRYEKEDGENAVGFFEIEDYLYYFDEDGYLKTGKIYVDLDTDKTYRWGGSAYAVISETLALGRTSTTAFPGDAGAALETEVNTNVTYVRQAFAANDPDDHTYTNNGKIYIKTGKNGTEELVEVYRRPWLNANSTADNPDGITKSTIGLGNVENKSAATIIGEITLSDLATTVGYATASQGGLMSSTDKAFLDDCMNVAMNFKAAEELALKLGLSRVLKRIGSTNTPLPREFCKRESILQKVFFRNLFRENFRQPRRS